MNKSQFMDKQIMDHSSTPQSSDFFDLMNPREDKIGGAKEEILASYDFQPIRPVNLRENPSNLDDDNGGGSRAWSSADSKTGAANFRNYSTLDPSETAKTAKVILQKDQNVCDAAIISEIDRAMKKHADNLLHALEGVSARLSQLESKTRHLEDSVDDLKVSVGNNQGSIDGKMRQLENILREVQTGVEDIRDKQEILEAHMQLAKLQVSKAEQKSDTQDTVLVDPVHAPQHQSNLQISPSAALQQPFPSFGAPNASLPSPTQQNFPPPALLPNQFPQGQNTPVSQREPYFPPPAQMHEAPNQQYPLPPTQQLQPPPPAPPHQPYQPTPQPQYSQPPPSLAVANPSPPQAAPLGHNPEEAPYFPSQNYPPGIRHPPSHPSTGAPPQPFYGPSSHSHEQQQSNRINLGYSAAYGPPPSSPSEHYSFSGSPSHYGSGTAAKAGQFSSAPMAQGGGGSYPQLPTARLLPQAIPTASGVNGGSSSGSGGSGNRVPVDDVVDKVTSMGFPRDHVKAIVRKLTDNGQAVDLNVVLDKLMNDGEIQPPKGWFGR